MISFQELCLMYCGEKDITNIDKEKLIYCMHIYEGLVSLDKSVQDKKLEISEFHKELNDKCLTKNYNELKENYQYLHDKWEQFSKCLSMGPEKFISMLDDLKEKLKSNGNEIAHLREQLKTSELDAKRYKNDGIQDRIKLQEVTEKLEKLKKFMDTPCKEVKGLIDDLKQMNDDKMDTISKLEATLFAVNKDKEMMLSYYAKELESITKMRDNWKADCEYSEKCFQAERDRRWELEEEVKQLKNQVQQLGNVLDEVCPRMKFDLSTYITSKKELDELVGKKLNKFNSVYLQVIGNLMFGFNIYLTFANEAKSIFIDCSKKAINVDDLFLIDLQDKYIIADKATDNHLYSIDKASLDVKKIARLEFEYFYKNKCCSCKKCKSTMTTLYFIVGVEKIAVDTFPFELRDYHYYISEDKINRKYFIVRKDRMQKDLHNYSIDKETLEVKVID